jgi:hypothetical protein
MRRTGHTGVASIQLWQHCQRALKVTVEALKTASGFIILPPGK